MGLSYKLRSSSSTFKPITIETQQLERDFSSTEPILMFIDSILHSFTEEEAAPKTVKESALLDLSQITLSMVRHTNSFWEHTCCLFYQPKQYLRWSNSLRQTSESLNDKGVSLVHNHYYKNKGY